MTMFVFYSIWMGRTPVRKKHLHKLTKFYGSPANYYYWIVCVYFQYEIPYHHLKIMYAMYWIGYTISLVFLLFAVVVFVHYRLVTDTVTRCGAYLICIIYRNLWCLRNIIHTNLVLCFALHNITWIGYSLFAHEFQMNLTAMVVLDCCKLYDLATYRVSCAQYRQHCSNILPRAAISGCLSKDSIYSSMSSFRFMHNVFAFGCVLRSDGGKEWRQ